MDAMEIQEKRAIRAAERVLSSQEYSNKKLHQFDVNNNQYVNP